MLAGLKKKKKGKARRGKALDKWSLYILKCGDGSFYTGITNNLERRLKMHQTGKASRYTRTHQPVEMLYSEKCGDRSSALIRECEVKEWPRAKKQALALGKEYGVRGTKKKKMRRTRNALRRTSITPADLRASAPEFPSA